MWNKGKQVISAGDQSMNMIAGGDINCIFGQKIPTELVDQKIEEEIERLRKSWFFCGFDGAGSSLQFGIRLAEGNLSGGSDAVRGRALAWCARFLVLSESLDRAENFLELSKGLGDSIETKIANAFVISQKKDKAAALQVLAALDSTESHSAGLMIVTHHDGALDAVNWMANAGYSIDDLDSDGKSFFLSKQLQLGRWEDVARAVTALSKKDFDESPVLHHLAALAMLLPTIPQDFRATVLTQVPFEVRDFPLASDATAMEARSTAHKYFLSAVESARQLVCPIAAEVDDAYAIWLELRTPVLRAHGKARLENKLRDPKTALGFVHFALQFDIELDLVAVERDIERSIAINGEMVVDAAVACFALSFKQPTHEEAANYISRYYDQLVVHIDTTLIRFRQIELLSRAGLIEKATEVFDLLLAEGVTAEQERSLRRIISEAQHGNPIQARKAQYETTKALADLINLVAELENRQHWDDLCKFGRRLFDETHSLGDAELLVNAFSKTNRSKELVDFLKNNSSLLSQSKDLRMAYAWGLYHEGEFLEARAMLAELSDEAGSQNYRLLKVNLGISIGDLAALTEYLADEYRHRNDRSPSDLIEAAQLALHLGLPLAKDLVFEAAAKAGDDACVLTAAYFIATNAGCEDDPAVFQWLEKAACQSGEDVPLQKMSLQDLLDQKPEWDRRESEILGLLAQGEIPIFLAAKSFNQTLVDLTTFPSLSNLTETDPRRRRVIPAYSGKSAPVKFVISGKTVAFDATALLTLSFLGILDVTLDAFGTVYVPHSTLRWLFNERQKATFHQPSRIADAHKVRDFLATDVLRKFNPSTSASSDLSVQIGDELAALIAEAEMLRDRDDKQHIVVRSSPVYRLSTLMEEEADVSAHTAVLSSCLAVVEKLRRKGAITATEEKRARDYLQLREKPWLTQPDIADGAVLYLDELAISYFLHLGLLGKFKAAGLTAVVSPREFSETDALISYERISEEVKEVIERIRASLNSRIESGHVKVGGACNFDGIKMKAVQEHPSVGMLALAPLCDVSIIDDRFFNRSAYIENGGTKASILSTLDLIDALVAASVLSEDARLEHRTRLRRAGYFFVPVTVEELERCLSESTVLEGVVVETAELKAIRESILRVRMSDWLRLPEEWRWLDGTLKAFVSVLKNLWADNANIDDITARSDWLEEQIDIRGWAHTLVPGTADNIVQIGRAVFILLLLSPPNIAQKSIVNAYWNWLEERVLFPIQEQFPKVYDYLVDWYRSDIARAAEGELSEEAYS